MGKIISEKTALNECHCFKIKADNQVCFSRGVQGTLSKDQVSKCKEITVKPASKTLKRHFQKLYEEIHTREEFIKLIGRNYL